MDNRALRKFTLLADTLHFGRASEACHISASALSRSIRQLEEQVGVKLFNRNNRSVALTSAGHRFLVYARDTLAQWDDIRNELLADAGELRGEVSMYCSVTASYSFLYELLNAFRRDYPHVEIKLHTGDPEHAIRRVVAGNEDIAIGARPNRLPAELAFKPIQISPLVFIAAKKTIALHEQRIKQEQIEFWSQTPMILSESGLARNRVDEWFRTINVQPDIYAQVAGNEAIVSMVSLGFGVGVVPEIVLQNSPLALEVRALDVQPALQPYEVGLFTQKKKLKSPLIAAFWGQNKRPH
jgi:LysR family positive regulator for ilvC